MTRVQRTGLILAVLLLSLLVFLLLWSIHHEEGYFAPVYSPDGNEVFYIHRESSGIVLGLGWEFFTPPAHVIVWRDRFSLKKLQVADRELQTVKEWPPSPLEKQRIRTYRGRIFSTVKTQLRWVDGDHLEYKVGVRVPSQPTAQQYYVSRVWNNVSGTLVEKGTWAAEWVSVTGYNQSPLAGDWEVIAVSGRELYPCALVSYHAVSSELRTLLKNKACDEIYPAGIPLDQVQSLSKRAEIERIEQIETTHHTLLEEARSRGLSEAEAALEVIEQMRDLGHYSKPPQLVAQLLTDAETAALRAAGKLEPVFEISEMQFTVGLFTDIYKAIQSPGEEVDKAGRYIIHREYTTSQQLNSFLQGGATQFYVSHAGRTYDLRIIEP